MAARTVRDPARQPGRAVPRRGAGFRAAFQPTGYVTEQIPGYGEVCYTSDAVRQVMAASRGKPDAVLRREAATGTDGAVLPGVLLGRIRRRDLVAILAGQQTARADARRELAAQEAAAYTVTGMAGSADSRGTVYDVRALVPGFEPLLVIVRVSEAGEIATVIDDSGTALTGPRRDKAAAAVAAWRAGE